MFSHIDYGHDNDYEECAINERDDLVPEDTSKRILGLLIASLALATNTQNVQYGKKGYLYEFQAP